MKNNEMVMQLKNRGIKNALLLKAFQDIPFSLFILKDFPTASYQEIEKTEALKLIETRALVIAKMLEQLKIKEGEKILTIGVDSVYILAALSKIYKEVYMVDAHKIYAEWAVKTLNNIGITNVFAKNNNQTLGWKAKAPFDVILIASELEEVPKGLKEQLNIEGKLLIPVGPDWVHSVFEIIQRVSETDYKTEKLRDNFFIPHPEILPEIESTDFPEKDIINEIKLKAMPFEDIKDFPIDDLLDRIGDAQVVLLGEASHGTSEFYLMRQEITKGLIEKKGFNFVCAEADWSDAQQINSYVKDKYTQNQWMPFARFPEWMWKNKEVLNFVEWLRAYNMKHEPQAGFYGLDLYGLENSILLVIDYLEKKDTELAKLAKSRYTCIMPYMSDPSIYGKMVLSNQLISCEKEILKMLIDLLKNKIKLNHSPEYFYAYQNANVVVDAERYYKAMYYGSADSWNLRDFHMFQTLKSLLSYFGPHSKAVVWAHNSHIGNALATEMYSRGEINIGHLCKEQFKNKSYHIGFGTHDGTVAAAHNWGGAMEIMQVNPSLLGSYENLCSQTQIANFTLPLRENDTGKKLRKLLNAPKLERAIGVMYRPKTERMSHYFQAVLPSQFDEYIWFNTSKAVTPITTSNVIPKLLESHPFA
ncbi:erythromycin esterase family protein [Gaetbulibacter aquiaggeris]|uniref:Erythromycin esterase family protein n=1 Tax=Gaetbulibacter aquiaggeris TaxID=1735373 RepID=A0ABW7MQZ3_9FLAO